MSRKRWLILLAVGIILVLGVVAWFLLKPNLDRGVGEVEEKFPDREIPRINIALNGVSLEEIDGGSKETKYEGNELKIYDRRSVLGEYGNVRVKGRGNGTWIQEKKSYQIRFGDKVDLFGMGKARKWILLANALDATNMRTDIAFYLENMLGMEYAFDGRFVELYIDEDYRGLYYLTHAVEIDKQSVALKDQLGVLVELDNLYGMAEQYYKTKNGDILVVKDVVDDDMTESAMELFLNDYNILEKAVQEKNYKKIEELVDIESFAQYYLLSEFVVNPDAYWTSFFMYKDGRNDKIHAGPGWDFDLSFANGIWGNWMGEEYYSPSKTMVRKGEILPKEAYEEMGLTLGVIDWYESSLKLSHLLFDMMEIPEFQDLVGEVYVRQMKGREDELICKIEQEATRIKEAVVADEEKWEDGGFWQKVEAMKRWISERYKYFDKVYGGKKVLIDGQ